jgi:hypothetical protein
MEKLLKIVKSKYFLLYALAIINLIVAVYIIKISLWSSDSETYLSAMNFLQGDKLTEIPYNRLITAPFMLYASIFFSFIFGSLFNGMLAVNIIFYFLIIYVFYKLALEIYQDHKIAFLSAALFLGDYGIYNFGTVYLADMGGWFFFILSSLLALKYYNDKNKKFYYLAVLAAGLGVLFKEYGALGMASLTILILISNFSWIKKFKEIIIAGLLFSAIPIIYNILFYLKFHYSYLDWYFFNVGAHGQSYGLILLIKVLGWLFLAGWPIFLYGLLQEKKYFNRQRAYILAALLPASLAFLAWPALTQRIAFIFVPWLALISGFGLSKIKNNYLTAAILIIYIIINYSITPFLIKAINLPF